MSQAKLKVIENNTMDKENRSKSLDAAVSLIEKNFYHYFILILISSFVAVIGDAAISLFKRVAEVKDTSNLIPGHGGLLDRIDSHLATIPVFIFILIILS